MLVELRIQFDRLELFLPIGLRRLERHIVGRVGGGLLVGHRVDGSLLLDGVGDGNVVGNFLAVVHGDRNTPRAVAENRCDLPFIPMRIRRIQIANGRCSNVLRASRLG